MEATRALQSFASSPIRKPLVLLLGVVAGGLPAAAQEIVHVNPVRAELSLEFDGLRSRSEVGPSESEYLFTERLRMASGGYVLHPGVLSFSAELAPALSQQITRSEAFDENANNRFLDYFVNLSALAGRPLSFDATSARSTGTTTAGFGSRAEFRTDTHRLSTTFSNPYFPLGLSYSKRLREQREEGGLRPRLFEVDEEEDNLSFWGRSSKMSVSLERTWFEEKTLERSQRSDTARLSHRLLRWGKGSSLDYDLDYLDREGFLPFRRWATNERLHLQHTQNLFTTYSHNYTVVSRERETRSHAGDVSLNHVLYGNLTTRVFVTGSSTDSEDERSKGLGGGLSFAYNKNLPRKAKLRLGSTGSYRVDDVETENGLSEVVGEVHVVDIAGVFFLNRRFVSPGTIVVSNANGTVVFTEGLDYRVVSVDGLTEIQILAGGRIAVGDSLLVDYLFDALPSREFSTTTFTYDTAIDYGWISAYHRGTFLRQKLLSGPSGTPLSETDDFTTGVLFTFSNSRSRATLGAENRHSEHEEFESDTFSFREGLQHALSPALSVTLNATQTLLESSGGDFITFNERLLLEWRPRTNLLFDLHGERWDRREEGGLTERFWEARPGVRWFVGRVELTSRYSHREWGGRLSGDRTEDRLTVLLKRRF
ncbi:MAG: hypothetical protein HY900_33600 [Deltaproteobacteria bacterium]|nr:hypothetical protein [Deltaproteobacteria bacterium]